MSLTPVIHLRFDPGAAPDSICQATRSGRDNPRKLQKAELEPVWLHSFADLSQDSTSAQTDPVLQFFPVPLLQACLKQVPREKADVSLPCRRKEKDTSQ